jgi:hypothetical protein
MSKTQIYWSAQESSGMNLIRGTSICPRIQPVCVDRRWSQLGKEKLVFALVMTFSSGTLNFTLRVKMETWLD